MSDNGIDPEGFVRFGGDCICGGVYTYAGHCDPGAFHPDCPVHWADAGWAPPAVGDVRDGGQS